MRTLKNQKGSTLVEVIVGFTILLILISMFQHAIGASRRLIQRANEIEQSISQDDEDFYKKKSNRSLISEEGITMEDSSGNKISVPGNLYQQEDSGRYYWEAGDGE